MKLVRMPGTIKCDLCPDVAIARLSLTEFGHDPKVRLAYGCQYHTDFAVDRTIEGEYSLWTVAVLDLGTGITTIVQPAPDPEVE